MKATSSWRRSTWPPTWAKRSTSTSACRVMARRPGTPARNMRLTAVSIEWGGEEHTFDLKLGQVRALQEKTSFGPALIAHRLQSGLWNVDDFRETLKQGLI